MDQRQPLLLAGEDSAGLPEVIVSAPSLHTSTKHSWQDLLEHYGFDVSEWPTAATSGRDGYLECGARADHLHQTFAQVGRLNSWLQPPRRVPAGRGHPDVP